MTAFVAFLRAINLGSRNRVSMKELRKLLESLHFSNIRTYLQSGNVVFCSPLSEEEIERKISLSIKRALGHDISVIVRTASDLNEIVSHNPFKNSKDQSKLHLTLLSKKPAQIPLAKEIDPLKKEGEEFMFAENRLVVYLHLPFGYGTSKLSNGLFERKLGVRATTRNWNTISSILKMAL